MTLALALAASSLAPAAHASSNSGSDVLQCVPYARDVTGIRIYGDAYTWWGQAAGKYPRGHEPRVGAVMAIRPYGNSRLGHVAAVSRVVDDRTVLLRHANWSSPGQIENDVRAVDVSPQNDWSEVRIWHGPSQQLGSRHWPLFGFIYKDGKGDLNKAGRSERKRPERDDLIGDIIAGRL
ncbi:MAG: CHAP domain-containing protein [Novosphingobium sp.]|nr:CHAP domain-containing protein [Novosphingobium sp.]